MANKALLFNGASGKITVSDDSAIQNIFDGGGSVEFLMNVRGEGEANLGRIFDKLGSYYAEVLRESGSLISLGFYHFFDGDNGAWETTTRVISLNASTHIIFTYNNDNVANNPIFYINGTAYTVGDGVTEYIAPTGTRDSDVGVDLTIGNNPGDARTFDGTINEVRLYTRIIGATEASNNYNGGAIRYWPSDFRNLVGWWHLNEGTGTNVRDETNRGNAGTIATATWTDGFDFLIQKNVPRRR